MMQQRLQQRLVGKAIRKNSPTLHIMGLGILLLAPGMMLSGIIEWASSSSHDEAALIFSSLIAAAIGLLFWASTEIKNSLSIVSVFSAVAWTWITSSLIGSLPYIFAGGVFGWGNWDLALFESISGFSCTGSTVLSDIESLGKGVLFWRQLTQWYGGMGMVVLAVSVLPYLGVGGLGLMAAEAPGQETERLVPRVSETAQRLWRLYVGITLVIAIALFIAPGPNLYDSAAHALTIASTGGFSPYNLSLGHFDSLAVELIAAFFLIYCAISFNLHYRALRGEYKVYAKTKDQSFYLKITGLAILLVALLNWNSPLFGGFWTSLRHSVFNVATLISSGGFANSRGEDSLGNFAVWTPNVQIILLFLMVMGGCVGSTAGGLKSYRVYMVGSHIKNSLKRSLHPHLVSNIKLGSVSVSDDIARRVMGFTTIFILFLIVGTLSIASMGHDLLTSFSGSVSAMSNMGPALGEAGPTANFEVFSRPARGVLMALMLVGRLEIMAILFMFISPLRALRRKN